MVIHTSCSSRWTLKDPPEVAASFRSTEPRRPASEPRRWRLGDVLGDTGFRATCGRSGPGVLEGEPLQLPRRSLKLPRRSLKLPRRSLKLPRRSVQLPRRSR